MAGRCFHECFMWYTIYHSLTILYYLRNYLNIFDCEIKTKLKAFKSFFLGEMTCSNCNGCIHKGLCYDYDPAGYPGQASKEACNSYGGTGC